jgi:hypothetical protein
MGFYVALEIVVVILYFTILATTFGCIGRSGDAINGLKGIRKEATVH